MAHIPNTSLRESLALGSIGVTGVGDAASPDNRLIPLVTPGIVDRCSVHDQSIKPQFDLFQRFLRSGQADPIRELFTDSIGGGLGLLVTTTYQLPAIATKTPQRLTQKDFEDAAASLKCEVAAVKAVAEVEARGAGFFADGRPKILFEAHHFARLTKQQYNLTHPNISSKKWNKTLYLGGTKEYDRLKEAMALDPIAAIQSASWGAFQIMGFNYKSAGFASPAEFVNAQYKNEGEHLRAFLSFVKSMKLDTHIQKKDWEAFAKGYNGPKYKDNNYDSLLAKAYEKHSKPAAPAKDAAKPKKP